MPGNAGRNVPAASELQPVALRRVYVGVNGTMTVGDKKLAHSDESPSDADLAQLIADGDRAAATTLIERHQAMVRGFLFRITGRHDLADDLAQETFLRVLRYAYRYDDTYTMRTWLLTIARRLWINGLRRDHRWASAPALGEPTSSEPDPAWQVGRADELDATRRLVDQALLRLTEPQRTALVLFHQQDLSLADAARVMSVPIGTVKSHLHRGRAALRRILAPKLETIEP